MLVILNEALTKVSGLNDVQKIQLAMTLLYADLEGLTPSKISI